MYIVIMVLRSTQFDDYERAKRRSVVVGLVNQRSGEHKYVKVGFSWVLLFFSGVLGIPLFLRRLYVWGAVFLSLWVLYVFSPQILPDTAHSAGTYLSLCLVFLALQIWIAVKGNEMTAKNLLENGWSFSSPNAQESHYAMMKWDLSNIYAPEHSQIQVPQRFSQRAPTQFSLPEPEISEPIPSAPTQDTIPPIGSVAKPIFTPRSSATMENHQRFWETKFDIYLRLCRAAGILAFVPYGSDEYSIAYKDLITICTGEFQLVASPDVSSALTAFVDHLQTGNTDRSGAEAQKLALACRQDTGAEFHLTGQEQTKNVEGLA